ncbi:MAG TPA: N-acetylmuramoyl-L-alanine amidase [Anaeromyxobacteraceae bacterium]|nr:N-acetylmuramoyl-L-alanine amidase [Anaeromyxobacteraceae bacterium]
MPFAPCPLRFLLALLLAMEAHCRAPSSKRETESLLLSVASCPVPLTDDALDALDTYDSCALPAFVARLVRNDYADDELEMPDLSSLSRFAGLVPRSAFEAQLERFIDPEGELRGTMAIDPERRVLRPDPLLAPGVEIAFAEDLPGAAPPCGGPSCRGQLVPPLRPERPYREARRRELIAHPDPMLPLLGLRIAIDPGHSGGPYGGIEERRFVARGEEAAPAVVLEEGDFTLRTALELRSKLVARGANVLLTRERASLVHGLPLHALRPYAEHLLRRLALDPRFQGLEQALEPAERLRLRTALALFAVKKQSRFESLRARARLAMAFRPDLFLSIHYNASPGPGGRAVREEVLAMVGGNFDRERLYNPYYRWRALEEAFAIDDFDASAHLGALCVRAMSDRLGLPVEGEPRYPDHLAIRDAQGRPTGVDAWDGALLRYLDGPAILVEGPYLDAREEFAPLEAALKAPLFTAGTRTERYAAALAACVEDFTRTWLRSERNPFGS